MSQPAPAKSEELSKELIDLIGAIGQLPTQYRDEIEPVLAKVVDASRRRRRILQLVQDALSQLRLDMKYLMFDLEATRREREEFRRRIEETQ